ncbi:MAG: type II and III secretion system protein, partial [Geovibrio sp.]|nr:type II and III secretion system protein [Geovibrio sp.]
MPITTTRSLTTTVRARPGDTILMAGINQSRDEADYESLPLVGSKDFATGKDTNVERTEIVIIMTPRVIRFDAPEEVRQSNIEKNADPLFEGNVPAADPG